MIKIPTMSIFHLQRHFNLNEYLKAACVFIYNAPVYSGLAALFNTFIPEELQGLIIIAKLLKVESITPALGTASYFLEPDDSKNPPTYRFISFFSQNGAVDGARVWSQTDQDSHSSGPLTRVYH